MHVELLYSQWQLSRAARSSLGSHSWCRSIQNPREKFSAADGATWIYIYTYMYIYISVSIKKLYMRIYQIPAMKTTYILTYIPPVSKLANLNPMIHRLFLPSLCLWVAHVFFLAWAVVHECDRYSKFKPVARVCEMCTDIRIWNWNQRSPN